MAVQRPCFVQGSTVVADSESGETARPQTASTRDGQPGGIIMCIVYSSAPITSM